MLRLEKDQAAYNFVRWCEINGFKPSPQQTHHHLSCPLLDLKSTNDFEPLEGHRIPKE